MTIVAKFTCQSVTAFEGAERVELHAAHGPGNESWSKATPGGNLQITISNPQARGKFAPGKSYMLMVDGPSASVFGGVTGEIGFNAYGDAGPTPWKTFNGADMPRWPSLAETPAGHVTRDRWAAAAKAEIAGFLWSHGLKVIPADVFANTPERIVPISTTKGLAITTTGNRA